MKRKLLVGISLVVVILCMGSALSTWRYGWSKPASATSTDDTLLTAAADTMKFANIPDGAYKPNENQNGIEVSWSMGADGQSCVAYLFAARKSGDIALVWTGTLTAGKQESTDERYWVDTIASATDNWIKPIILIDYSGSDRQSRMVLDTCGYYYFFWQYTGLSSESIKEEYSGY